MSENRWQLIYIIWLKWRQQIRKPRVYVGYLAGGVCAFSVACRYAGFSSGLGVQIMEPWILMMNYWGDLLFLAIGFLAVITDAPFVDSLSQSVMLRSKSKRIWNQAMILYIMVHSLLYWMMIMLVSCIPCFFVKHHLSDQWSSTMKILLNVIPTNAITQYRLNPCSVQLLRERAPFEAALWGFLMIVLCSVVMALFVYLVNLKTGRPLGAFAVLVIMLYSVLIIRDGGMNGLPFEASFLAHAIVDLHGSGGMSMISSLMLFVVLGGILTLSIKKVSKHCDYREVNGNRLW